METIVKETAHFAALIAESVAILIILMGVLKTVALYLGTHFPFKTKIDKHEIFLNMRIQLGSYLSLGLEFLIGGDILKTAISPNWNDIGMLGAIVVIRTVLNYFLTLELRSEIKKAANE